MQCVGFSPHKPASCACGGTKIFLVTDPNGIQSSETTGDPLVLANSVFFAIRQAVIEARKEAGITTPLVLASPANLSCHVTFPLVLVVQPYILCFASAHPN